jgi:hypothetical protein
LIARDILIEDLVTILPESVPYLMERGIRVLVCGEPLWGTLGSVASDAGFSAEQIDEIISGLSGLHPVSPSSGPTLPK